MFYVFCGLECYLEVDGILLGCYNEDFVIVYVDFG